MRQAARSINGELYLLCGDKVYAIELTARRCGDQFVVTRFWQYRLVNTEPGKVREAAQEVIRGFNQEKAEMPQNVEVKGARQVYLELKS